MAGKNTKFTQKKYQKRNTKSSSPALKITLTICSLLVVASIVAAVALSTHYGVISFGDFFGRSSSSEQIKGLSGDEESNEPLPSSDPNEPQLPTNESTLSEITNSDVDSASVKIAMVGDVLLHKTTILSNAEHSAGTYDFSSFTSEISSYLNKADLRIMNMEGPVNASGGNKNITSYPCFNYPEEIIQDMKNAGFNFMLTANNHAFDKGMQGVITTRNHMVAEGVDFTGTFETREQSEELFIKSYGGVKIGILSYSALDNGMANQESLRPHLEYVMPRCSDQNTDDVPKVLKHVEMLKAAGAEFVIMAFHWGDEYDDQPTAMQKTIAKLLVEGGVDILLGDHSHCVQPIEMRKVVRNNKYRDAMIVYSTGNFLADQIALNKIKTQEGMMVNVGLSRDKNGVFISAANYMPTICQKDSLWKTGGKSVGYRVIPSGKYADPDTQPDDISSAIWKACKNGWNRVPKIVGKSIPCITG